jgi:hypothetical protein
MISFCCDVLKWVEIIDLPINCDKTARKCETTADAPVCNTCMSVIPVIPVQNAEPFNKSKHARRSKIGKKDIAFKINDTEIPYSFYMLVLKQSGNDIETAGRVFFRAKCRAQKNPIGWIQAGLVGEKYAFKSVREEDEDPAAVRQWIDSTVNHYTDV